jgi:hypothetical protein
MLSVSFSIIQFGLLLALLVFMSPVISICEGARWDNAYDEKLNKTLFVNCGNAAPFVSREVQSPALVSSDNLYSAYVITIAKYENDACSNRTRLMIKGPKDLSFRVVREILPKPYELGNGLQMIDWSPTGHFLALKCHIFQYASDFGWIDLRIYDAENDRFIIPPLDKMFSKIFHGHCSIRLAAVLGFSPAGQLILAVGDYWTVDEEIDNNGPRCIGDNDQIWILDFHERQIRRSISEQHPKTYGNILP